MILMFQLYLPKHNKIKAPARGRPTTRHYSTLKQVFLQDKVFPMDETTENLVLLFGYLFLMRKTNKQPYCLY